MPRPHLIRKSNTAQKDPHWNGNNLRIRTKITADNFYSAVEEGYRKISAILDCIAFRSDFSFPEYLNNEEAKPLQFSSYRFFSRIKAYPKIFCKEIGHESHLFYDLQTLSENKLVFDFQANRFFEPVRDLFENLLVKDYSSLEKIERSLLSSCHWLRLGIFSGDLIERLIFLYNSLEFAVSGISVEKKFPSAKLSEIKTKLQEIELDASQLEILRNRINDLNNASLFETIKQFCEKNNVSITDNEWELIRSTRNKRNEIIHGKKDIKVESTELEKLQTLIEKILLKRVEEITS